MQPAQLNGFDLVVALLVMLAMLIVSGSISRAQQQQPSRTVLDPTSWGTNHAGKPIPEYVHGDECLFCHRNSIGVTWQKNSHGVTIRQHEDAPELQSLARKQPQLSSVTTDIKYFMGSRHQVRFLKKNGYGKFWLLNTRVVLGPNLSVEKLIETPPSWDKEKFANRCAGCHTTGVDSAAKTFAGFGIDCYACHGDVTLEHTNNTSLMWLSKKRRDDSRAIISICAQCHVRSGKSRSTGLPYANNFIAGDNLFQDFVVDLAKADDETLNPGDRHVLKNIREVVLYGDLTTNCLTCHDVHVSSTTKHREATRGAICADCHGTKFTMKPKPYEVHSELCEY